MRRRNGFTLIELLTVIAIIGVLAAIIIPVTGKVRATARRAQCASNLRQVGIAILAYADDTKGRLPGPLWVGMETYAKGSDKKLLGTLLAPYLGIQLPDTPSTIVQVPVLNCPAWKAATSSSTGKAWNMGKNALMQGGPYNGSNKPPFGNDSYAAAYLSWIANPSQAEAMIDAENSSSGITKPVHGNVRNRLYLDAHVKAIPVENP